MIQELFLYDRDEGLFKEILKKSTVIKGSYHVSTNHGNDLNASNLETYVKDPANGLIDDKKYPICICVTPRSRQVKVSGQPLEQFTFNLYFLSTTFRTPDNKIKLKDKDTNVSAHHVWYDWQDMKNCAMNFCFVLSQVIRTRTILIDNQLIGLRTQINFDSGNVIYNRMTKFNNDQLTGVSIAFPILMNAVQCDTEEYVSIDDIVIPSPIIHGANDDKQ